MKNILFVCTGNSCRSVMAEGLFKKMTEELPGYFNVGSAGISAMDGFGPTQETVRAMREEGVDVSRHRSRRLTLDMVRQADKIFVMEEMHRSMILRLMPDAESKVFMLSEFSPEPNERIGRRDIPDPIRMSDSFYKNVVGVVRDCVAGVVHMLTLESGGEKTSNGNGRK